MLVIRTAIDTEHNESGGCLKATSSSFNKSNVNIIDVTGSVLRCSSGQADLS